MGTERGGVWHIARLSRTKILLGLRTKDGAKVSLVLSYSPTVRAKQRKKCDKSRSAVISFGHGSLYDEPLSNIVDLLVINLQQ